MTQEAELAKRLKTAHQSLAVALSAVTEVIGGLADMLGREHLTAQCHAGQHVQCPRRCRCTDCTHECECTCHLLLSGLRV